MYITYEDKIVKWGWKNNSKDWINCFHTREAWVQSSEPYDIQNIKGVALRTARGGFTLIPTTP